MENNKKINWFIGHMKKTIDIFSDKKKNVDFIIEVIDARLPYSSSNYELISIFNNKPIIKIAVKSDLIKKENYQKDLIYISTKNPIDRKKAINYIDSCLKEKKDNLIKKGLRNPTFIGMVVGLPNIGKSSLINFLANKKSLNVENRPGVTRKMENIKISDTLFLVDTPGVFLKRVDDYETGLSLALINCVKRDLVDKKDIILFLIDRLVKNNNLTPINDILNYELKETDPLIILNKLLKHQNINIVDDEKSNIFYDFLFKKILDEGKYPIFLEDN